MHSFSKARNWWPADGTGTLLELVVTGISREFSGPVAGQECVIRLFLIPMHTTGFLLQVDYLELKKLLAAGRLEDRKPRRIILSPSDVAHVRLGLIDHSGSAHAFAHLCQYRAEFRDRNFFLRPLFPLRSKMNSPAVDRYQARTNGEPEGYQTTIGRIERFLLSTRHTVLGAP
jgi:hypothetical protein